MLGDRLGKEEPPCYYRHRHLSARAEISCPMPRLSVSRNLCIRRNLALRLPSRR